MRITFRIYSILILLTMLIGVSLHCHERVQFHKFMQINGDYLYEVDEMEESQHIIECRNKLKTMVSDDISTFRKFNSHKRPSLGYSLRFILKYRETHCAEFTRLLYNVYGWYGVKTRPVVLFGPNSQLHYVLEVKSPKDGWFLIDTANSPAGFATFLDSTFSSVYDLRTSKQGYPTASEIDMPYYTQYSYFNIAKITYGILGVTAYLVNPLPDFLVFITQNVYLFWTITIVLIELIIVYIVLLVRNLLTKSRE